MAWHWLLPRRCVRQPVNGAALACYVAIDLVGRFTSTPSQPERCFCTLQVVRPDEFNDVSLKLDPKTRTVALLINDVIKLDGCAAFDQRNEEDRGVIFGAEPLTDGTMGVLTSEV